MRNYVVVWSGTLWITDPDTGQTFLEALGFWEEEEDAAQAMANAFPTPGANEFIMIKELWVKLNKSMLVSILTQNDPFTIWGGPNPDWADFESSPRKTWSNGV
jgi:hypothetical protein